MSYILFFLVHEMITQWSYKIISLQTHTHFVSFKLTHSIPSGCFPNNKKIISVSPTKTDNNVDVCVCLDI